MPYKDPETRRLKQRAYSKRHYEANKETIIEKTKPVKLRNKEKWSIVTGKQIGRAHV